MVGWLKTRVSGLYMLAVRSIEKYFWRGRSHDWIGTQGEDCVAKTIGRSIRTSCDRKFWNQDVSHYSVICDCSTKH